MGLEFTEEASNDLEYIQTFLIDADVSNYQQIVADIIEAADNLLVFPRIGSKVANTAPPNEVRDYYHKGFCLRYLITPMCLYILRVWHQRENERNL